MNCFLHRPRIEDDIAQDDIVGASDWRQNREYVFAIAERVRRQRHRVRELFLHEKELPQELAIQVHAPLQLHVGLTDEQRRFLWIHLRLEAQFKRS